MILGIPINFLWWKISENIIAKNKYHEAAVKTQWKLSLYVSKRKHFCNLDKLAALHMCKNKIIKSELTAVHVWKTQKRKLNCE